MLGVPSIAGETQHVVSRKSYNQQVELSLEHRKLWISIPNFLGGFTYSKTSITEMTNPVQLWVVVPSPNVSDSLQFQARRAPVSMGFLGKNTGVGCHFLLQLWGRNLNLLWLM